MIVSSMFYTRREQTARAGYWCELPCYTTVDIFSHLPIVLMSGPGEWTRLFALRVGEYSNEF